MRRLEKPKMTDTTTNIKNKKRVKMLAGVDTELDISATEEAVKWYGKLQMVLNQHKKKSNKRRV